MWLRSSLILSLMTAAPQGARGAETSFTVRPEKSTQFTVRDRGAISANLVEGVCGGGCSSLATNLQILNGISSDIRQFVPLNGG